MTRHVYPTDEVIHMWANRATIADGVDIRNPHGNVYTIHGGRTLLSYGTHYVMGAWVRHGKEEVLLLNADSSTATTNKHKSLVWRSLPGYYTPIWVNGLHAEDIKSYAKHAAVLVKKACDVLAASDRQRERRQGSLRQAASMLTDATKLFKMAGKRYTFPPIKEDASKEEIRTLLPKINRKYCKDKRNEYLSHAQQSFNMATSESYHYGTSQKQYESRAAYARETLCALADAEHFHKIAGYKKPLKTEPLRQQTKQLLADLEKKIEGYQREQTVVQLRKAAEQLYSYLHGTHSHPDAYTPLVTDYARAYFNLGDNFSPATPILTPEEYQALFNRQQRVLHFRLLRHYATTGQGRLRQLEEAWADVWPDLHGTARVYWLALYEEAHERLERKQEEHRLAELARLHDRIEAWKAGEAPRSAWDLPTMGRVKDGQFETTRGAVVPVEDAVRFMRVAQRVAAAGGKSWPDGSGPRVGPYYRCQSIDADLSVTIGCHTFDSEEAHRLVEVLTAYEGTVTITTDTGPVQVSFSDFQPKPNGSALHGASNA